MVRKWLGLYNISGDVPLTDEIARVPSDHMNPSLSAITSSSIVIRNQASEYHSMEEAVPMVNGATATSLAPLSHNNDVRNENQVSINPNAGLSLLVDNDVRMLAASHEGAPVGHATALPVVGGAENLLRHDNGRGYHKRRSVWRPVRRRRYT
ncbi:hypothetical protein NE237_024920 [Protea cynaroides]|uniref:Uncharacterized protein n=1 Tax=Protea cynaroides TaxID=273540 RepID=A0A9Q0H250_9MAGN|nr:hypothetical protein NE237_024920 [Protea cynaroides]